MGRGSDNMQGAGLMMASMASFTFGDACIKALGAVLPLSQILVIRGSVAVIFVLCLATALGQLQLRMSGRDARMVALRCASEAGATVFFLTALIHMPLANITALLQTLPLTVTLGAALVFGEKVGWRRWLAIAVGFAGMLMIVRPGGDGFDLWSIYALIAVLCVTARDLATRRISSAVPSLTVTFYAASTVVMLATIWSMGQAWEPISGSSALLLVAASICIVGGYSFSVMVMRVGEMSFVAPFRYTGLIWALLLGFIVFGDWPELLTLIGSALIVATGLFTLWRETQTRG